MEGQLSIFDMALNTEDGKKDEKHQLYPEDEDIYPDIPEYSQKILLSMEKEMLGLYISGHPLSELKRNSVKWLHCTARIWCRMRMKTVR